MGSPRKTVACRTRNYELMVEHFKVACEPYYYVRENYSTGEVETKIKLSDMIDEDKSLINLVKAFIKQSPKHTHENQQKQRTETKQEQSKQKEKEANQEERTKTTEDQVTLPPELELPPLKSARINNFLRFFNQGEVIPAF